MWGQSYLKKALYLLYLFLVEGLCSTVQITSYFATSQWHFLKNRFYYKQDIYMHNSHFPSKTISLVLERVYFEYLWQIEKIKNERCQEMKYGYKQF